MLGVFYGCTTRSNDRLKNNLEKILEKTGVEYVPLGVELCCGAPLLLAGDYDSTVAQAKKIEQSIADSGVDEIATGCPHCFTLLGHEYEEIIGHPLPVKVIHITQLLHRLLGDGKLKLSKPVNKKIAYHDPCYIGRQGAGIYDEPREVVNAIPGIECIEPQLSKENSTCCGGGGLLRAYLANLAVQIAKEKIEQQLKPLGVDAVVSSCPFCFQNLADGADLSGDFQAFELMELLLEAIE